MIRLASFCFVTLCALSSAVRALDEGGIIKYAIVRGTDILINSPGTEKQRRGAFSGSLQSSQGAVIGKAISWSSDGSMLAYARATLGKRLSGSLSIYDAKGSVLATMDINAVPEEEGS